MRGLPLDETLVYVAADLIAEAWQGRPVQQANRQGFFQIYNGNNALNCLTKWTPSTVSYDGVPIKLPTCVCPPWIPCYCDPR